MSAAALVTDLFFVTKIKGTADAVGAPLTLARTTEQLLHAIGAGARLAIIDLNATGVDPVDAIRRCKALPDPPRVLAYLSHVQRELAEAAQAAGADEVLPRSKFSADLPALLQQP
jgi:DNA-binding NarL/FixJ family response regulator